LALLAVAAASCALAVEAWAALPQHIAARIEGAARESRELAQRDAALVQYLNAQHLASIYSSRAGRSAEAGMNAVVIGAIVENPALAADVVAAAIAVAPELRASIASNAAKAFPGLAAEIAAAAGGLPAPPPFAPIAPPRQPVFAPAPAPPWVAPAAPAPPLVSPAAPAPSDFAIAEGGPGEEIKDPYEGFNRGIFAFNDTIDTYLLRPIAKAYGFIMPDVGKRLVNNFVQNLNSPVVLANDLLQLEGNDAAVTTGRFIVNSTFGVGGLFDVAAAYGLKRHHADFGQTLHSYGAGPGSYVMIPVLGPSTVRDGVGLAVDTAFNPLTYLLGTPTNLAITGGKGVVERETLIEPLDDLRASSVDYYAALRSTYYQDRAVELRKGTPADTTELDTLFESVE
jgi:phospholipid-binding lipoprotein MlaA